MFLSFWSLSTFYHFFVQNKKDDRVLDAHNRQLEHLQAWEACWTASGFFPWRTPTVFLGQVGQTLTFLKVHSGCLSPGPFRSFEAQKPYGFQVHIFYAARLQSEKFGSLGNSTRVVLTSMETVTQEGARSIKKLENLMVSSNCSYLKSVSRNRFMVGRWSLLLDSASSPNAWWQQAVESSLLAWKSCDSCDSWVKCNSWNCQVIFLGSNEDDNCLNLSGDVWFSVTWGSWTWRIDSVSRPVLLRGLPR